MIKTPRGGTERATYAELVDRLQLSPSSVAELVHRAEGLLQSAAKQVAAALQKRQNLR